jgi:hypothetical protein
MTMRPILAILLLLAAIPLCHAGGGKPPPKTPAAQTRQFLDTYGQATALQEIKQLNKMRPLLSKDLFTALRDARIRQDALAETPPGGKPGLVEVGPAKAGLVKIGFNSGEENAFDSYTVGLTNSPAKNRSAVDVEFVRSAQDTPVRWKDRYEWVLEGSTWKLDDIVYRSDGRPSRRERRLKALLRPH